MHFGTYMCRTKDLSLFPFFYCPLIVHKSSTSTCIKPFYGFCLSFQYFNSRFPFGNPLEITVTGVSAYSDGTCNNKMVHALICTCMHWLDLALPSHDFSFYIYSQFQRAKGFMGCVQMENACNRLMKAFSSHSINYTYIFNHCCCRNVNHLCKLSHTKCAKVKNERIETLNFEVL